MIFFERGRPDMADNDPNLDMPELEEKAGFPWIGIVLAVVVVILVVGWYLHRKPQHQGQVTAVAAFEQQLNVDRAVLEDERHKVFVLTDQLEALKQQIESGELKGKDKEKAVADYSQLAAEQRAQREKVKTLADQYNEKVANLRKLK
jgi:hypothetical protein